MQRSGQQRPGGRTRRTGEAVLAATERELLVHGYDNFRIDRVAVHAGVHRSTIYRRWGTKDHLLVDAATQLTVLELPDTGTLAGDLFGFLGGIRALLEPDAADRHLLAAGAIRPDLAPHVRQLIASRFTAAAGLVERGITRGELPADTDPGEVVRLVVAPLYCRALVTQEALTDEVLGRSVSVALAAARAGLLRAPAVQAPA